MAEHAEVFISGTTRDLEVHCSGQESLDVREASRLQMRLYLARALVAKGKNLRDDSLREFENIVGSLGLGDDARLLLDGIGRTTEDSNLLGIVESMSHYLDREKKISRSGT